MSANPMYSLRSYRTAPYAITYNGDMTTFSLLFAIMLTRC